MICGTDSPRSAPRCLVGCAHEETTSQLQRSPSWHIDRLLLDARQLHDFFHDLRFAAANTRRAHENPRIAHKHLPRSDQNNVLAGKHMF